MQMITASAIVYADLIYLRIQTHGFFSDDWKMTAVVEQVSLITLVIIDSWKARCHGATV